MAVAGQNRLPLRALGALPAAVDRQTMKGLQQSGMVGIPVQQAEHTTHNLCWPGKKVTFPSMVQQIQDEVCRTLIDTMVPVSGS